LYKIWGLFDWANPDNPYPKDDSLSLIYTRTRLRCRRVLEHLFRVHSPEVFESIIDCWNQDKSVRIYLNPVLPHLDVVQVPPAAAFELVDVLIASAQSTVHMICESISTRISGVSEKTKKQAINPDLLVHLCSLLSLIEQIL
jgi:hypothetical protein